jgi:lysophospholipid hydrolase
MSLDEDKSFYFVVDGVVQVFAQTEQPTKLHRGSWDGEDLNGYQLLNEVGAGGTLSSLFKILSLFTEHVQISWQNEDIASASQSPRPERSSRSQRSDSVVSLFDLNAGNSPSPRTTHARRTSISSSGSTVHAQDASSPSPLNSSRTRQQTSSPSSRPPRPPSDPRFLHRGVVARATEDTTLAVIPAEAFHRLTKKFPKATAHIVQGKPCLNAIIILY